MRAESRCVAAKPAMIGRCEMRLLIGSIMIGMFGGVAAIFLWTLLWTVVTPVPWLTHEAFYSIVFVSGGLGTVALVLPGMLR